MTDQLLPFAQEVAHAVRTIENDYDMSEENAIKIVQIAVEDMKTEVFHHYSSDGIKHTKVPF